MASRKGSRAIEIKLRPPIKHLDGVLVAGFVKGGGKHAMNFSGHSLNTSNGFKRYAAMCRKYVKFSQHISV